MKHTPTSDATLRKYVKGGWAQSEFAAELLRTRRALRVLIRRVHCCDAENCPCAQYEGCHLGDAKADARRVLPEFTKPKGGGR